jgi:membrane associated rhomboid family serine protease
VCADRRRHGFRLKGEIHMIPLRDANPSRGVPTVNYTIIGVCVLVFLFELLLGRNLRYFFILYGLVPIRYTDPRVAAHFTMLQQVLPFFAFMFLHGGWLHLIGNMWVLYIFGDNVESALGHARYAFFYLACGLLSAGIHVLTNLGSHLPTIGASGAIAGVMGAYFILYPRARILTLVPIIIFFTVIELPAYVFLAFWFLIQFYHGTFSLLQGAGQLGGIAWWAHVGGFLAGIFLLRLMLPRRRLQFWPR